MNNKLLKFLLKKFLQHFFIKLISELNLMKSKTISEWEKLVKNPTEEYREYFDYEYEYLKNNLSKNILALDIGCGDGRTIKKLAKYDIINIKKGSVILKHGNVLSEQFNKKEIQKVLEKAGFEIEEIREGKI